jgi:hypothetical protein
MATRREQILKKQIIVKYSRNIPPIDRISVSTSVSSEKEIEEAGKMLRAEVDQLTINYLLMAKPK